jgi:excinuclease UvrABC helicase subunit UvrB
MEKKLTYHKRMKQKIFNKMEGITPKVEERKLKKVEMIDLEKDPSAEHVLRTKEQCGYIRPKLRVIRTGLPIRLGEVDARIKNDSKILV